MANTNTVLTVPVGLNGWQTWGEVIINGEKTTFPVGVETSLPPPVAELVLRMIAEEEAASVVPDPVGCEDFEAREQIAALSEEIDDLKENGGGVQPDWNQNDPTAADYVKNRTHYEEPGFVEVMPERSFETVDLDGIYGYEEENDGINIGSTSGDTIIIQYDGMDYPCTVGYHEGMGGHFAGNHTLVGGSGGEEYPFVLMWIDGEVLLIGTTDTSPTAHSISIVKDGTVVHTLQEKFLPNYAVKKDAATAISGTFTSFPFYNLLENVAQWPIPEEGKSYKVTVVADGTATVNLLTGSRVEMTGSGMSTVESKPVEWIYASAEGWYIQFDTGIPICETADKSAGYYLSSIVVSETGKATVRFIGKGDVTYNSTIANGSFTYDISIEGLEGTAKAAMTHIPLWSTTKGSTKRFRITVDDSGTLTATEV